jgi:hypothetical protein
MNKENRKTYLDKLYYEADKQRGNLQLVNSYLDKEGNPKFSKWKKYLDCEEIWINTKANNRTILPNEIVLDIEEPEKYSEIIERVKKEFEFYSSYLTGSRGYHIHLWFNEDLSSDEKKAVIENYGTDILKGGNKCLIALENCPHWKTGNPKTLIEEDSKEGFNGVLFIKKLNLEKKDKNEKENKSNFEYLIEDRQKYESLGCGFHNDIYYFGTKLFKNGKPFMAVVTSDKNLYIKKEFYIEDEDGKQKKKIDDEIKRVFGLNYKDDFYDEGLDNILSKEAINKWLFEDSSDITIKEVYNKLVEIFKKYIYLEDERKYSLLACYRIASFFMPVWRARARLFIYAEMGSAKSRLTQILHNTGFNSVSLGDWTLPYLQRLIESTRGETHIDDYETLEEEKKNATTRLVKTGFMKGFKAGKIGDGIIKKPETYDLFNTTTLNNTEGLDFISTDRCITIRIPKISKKDYDKEPNFSEPIWKELRDKLYILGLKYSKEVSEIYESITSEKIRGRLFFIIKPELTIAKLISEELYKELEDFWIGEIEQRQNIDYETDWEFLAYKQIYKLLSTHSTNSTLSTHSTLSTTNYFSLLEEIVKPIGLEMYSHEEFKAKKRSMGIVIGNSLSRNPIFKKRQVKGKNQYKVNFEEFKSLLEAKGFLKPILDILEVDKVDRGDSVASETCRDTEKNKSKAQQNLSNFTDEQIKQAGYTREELESALKEN